LAGRTAYRGVTAEAGSEFDQPAPHGQPLAASTCRAGELGSSLSRDLQFVPPETQDQPQRILRFVVSTVSRSSATVLGPFRLHEGHVGVAVVLSDINATSTTTRTSDEHHHPYDRRRLYRADPGTGRECGPKRRRVCAGLRAGNAQLRMLVVACCQDFYHSRRRHSSAGLMSPIQYQTCCGATGRSVRGTFTIRGGSPIH
jgi:hypothetical protein